MEQIAGDFATKEELISWGIFQSASARTIPLPAYVSLLARILIGCVRRRALVRLKIHWYWGLRGDD